MGQPGQMEPVGGRARTPSLWRSTKKSPNACLFLQLQKLWFLLAGPRATIYPPSSRHKTAQILMTSSAKLSKLFSVVSNLLHHQFAVHTTFILCTHKPLTPSPSTSHKINYLPSFCCYLSRHPWMPTT